MTTEDNEDEQACEGCGTVFPVESPLLELTEDGWFCTPCLEDVPTAICPRCGTEVPDHDGFGVLAHVKPAFADGCGYCTHPSRDIADGKSVCGICGDTRPENP